jgi:hypothetical protein
VERLSETEKSAYIHHVEQQLLLAKNVPATSKEEGRQR